MSNKTDTLTDKDLVEKVLGGEANAFSLIIKNTEGLVAQIVFKMVANEEDRKDVVQDIYLKAYKKLAGFRFGSKLSTWVGQIAYNTCLDYIRKKKLVLTDNLYEEAEQENDLLEGKEGKASFTTAQTDSFIFQKQLSMILKTEIEKLSPVFKTLITLYHNEELSYDEIARITELPEGTVKSYLFRARKALRDSLLRNYKKQEL